MFREHLFRSILNFSADFFQNLKYQKCPIKRSSAYLQLSCYLLRFASSLFRGGEQPRVGGLNKKRIVHNIDIYE